MRVAVVSPGPVRLHHVHIATSGVTCVRDTCVEEGGHSQYGGKISANMCHETALMAWCYLSYGWVDN